MGAFHPLRRPAVEPPGYDTKVLWNACTIRDGPCLELAEGLELGFRLNSGFDLHGN
jgi:hypothetical protein